MWTAMLTFEATSIILHGVLLLLILPIAVAHYTKQDKSLEFQILPHTRFKLTARQVRAKCQNH